MVKYNVLRVDKITYRRIKQYTKKNGYLLSFYVPKIINDFLDQRRVRIRAVKRK